ncbi:hypothetical protein GCM10009680_72910 [Streptomyces yatensis]|uniref:Uncharacterized protein n=1 Tax=Streptomyces yatensis TaxID=155177 RepID=A0ABP4VA26_9ACTN
MERGKKGTSERTRWAVQVEFPSVRPGLETYLRGRAADRGVQRRDRPGAGGVPGEDARGDGGGLRALGVRTPAPAGLFSGIRYGPRNRGSRLASGPTRGRVNGLDSAFTVSLVVHRPADRPCTAAVLRKEPIVMATGKLAENHADCV